MATSTTKSARAAAKDAAKQRAAATARKMARDAARAATGRKDAPAPADPEQDQAAEQDQAEQQAETPTPMEQARGEATRLVVRYRRQLAPLAGIGATWAIGGAASAASGPAAAGVLLAAGAGTALGYTKLKPRLGRWGRAYAAVACTASMGWEVAAALAGAHNLQAALWLGGSALALPWWIRHSERTPDVTAEEEAAAAAPEPETPPEPDWRSVRWGKYLGAKGRPLPGSKLTEVTEIPYGWTATVDLGRGEHWSKAATCCDTIGSVFDLPDGRALIEPIQGAPSYKAHLTVLTTNPLEAVTKWTGPGLNTKTGTFPLALTADGQMLDWRLWWPGAGMCHGLVAGTTGSGKSATLDLILSEVAKSDRLIPIIIDGSGGMSVPDWIPYVPYKATTVEETIDLLERLVAAMFGRFEILTTAEWTDKKGRKRTGRHSIDPTPEMPGIVIVFDEAHVRLMDETYGKRIRRLVEILAQMGRKVAMCVVLATQQPSVTQLGGSSVIRDMCKSGNVVGLRTGERVSGGMVGNVPLPEPLHTLPAAWPDGSPTQGLGYVTTARAIRSRTLWVEDPFDAAENQTPVTLDAGTKRHLDTPAAPAATETTTGPASSAGPATATINDEVITQVEEAIASGIPAEPAAIARETGLTWRQAKTALAALTD